MSCNHCRRSVSICRSSVTSYDVVLKPCSEFLFVTTGVTYLVLVVSYCYLCNARCIYTVEIHYCDVDVFCTAEGCSKVTLEDILNFVTGADRVPPLGFPGSITVDFFSQESERHYPTSSTCDMRLWLPRGVSDVNVLQALMEEAILGSHGFGKY